MAIGEEIREACARICEQLARREAKIADADRLRRKIPMIRRKAFKEAAAAIRNGDIPCPNVSDAASLIASDPWSTPEGTTSGSANDTGASSPSDSASCGGE
jgi:hypothetical protein